jgi:hypothetical protein
LEAKLIIVSCCISINLDLLKSPLMRFGEATV